MIGEVIQSDLDLRSGAAPQKRTGLPAKPEPFGIRVHQPPISHNEVRHVEADGRLGD